MLWRRRQRVSMGPVRRTCERAPLVARQIVSQAHEISFNGAQLAELPAVALINDLIDQRRLSRGTREGCCRRSRLHRILMADGRESFDPHGRLNNHFDFFEWLNTLGQRAARRFLDDHFEDVGRRSTVDDAARPRAEVARCRDLGRSRKVVMRGLIWIIAAPSGGAQVCGAFHGSAPGAPCAKSRESIT